MDISKKTVYCVNGIDFQDEGAAKDYQRKLEQQEEVERFLADTGESGRTASFKRNAILAYLSWKSEFGQ